MSFFDEFESMPEPDPPMTRTSCPAPVNPSIGVRAEATLAQGGGTNDMFEYLPIYAGRPPLHGTGPAKVCYSNISNGVARELCLECSSRGQLVSALQDKLQKLDLKESKMNGKQVKHKTYSEKRKYAGHPHQAMIDSKMGKLYQKIRVLQDEMEALNADIKQIKRRLDAAPPPPQSVPDAILREIYENNVRLRFAPDNPIMV
eukprot:1803046-Rhodomonas_salina.3